MEDDIQLKLATHDYGAAFDLLVERFKEKVFHLACSMLRNETQAEDAAQDTFVKIWKGLPGYNREASLSTWIYTITRNTCLTELKKRSTRPTVSLQDPEMELGAEHIPTLRTTDADQGSEMDVETLLAGLPEKYRQVVTLFYMEQKKYEEVSAMLGIPMGTVKTLLFRAKKELLKIGTRHAGGAAEITRTPGNDSVAHRTLLNPEPALTYGL